MLNIIGSTSTPEYQAANDLASRINAAWPDIASSSQHQLTLVATAKCYGQPVCDIDLLVLFHTTTPYQLPPAPGDTRPLYLGSLCMVIEIKDHSPNRVRVVGTNVEVQYHDRWHNVSEQNFKQRFAVKGFLETQEIKPPFIVNLIWLRNVPETRLPPLPHNLIGQDASWNTILERFRLHTRPFWNTRAKKLQSNAGGDMPNAIRVFSETRKLQSTDIENTKIKGVIRAGTLTGQVPAYVAKLGSQLLIIQGRGGTGKTATLLKLAHVLYEHRKARVLILTYNRALVADIRRLLALMDVRDGVAQQSIAVQTAHSFFYQLMQGFGILPDQCNDFIERYNDYKMSLEMLLSAHSASVRELIQENNTAFSWDFIFIDEAQDWPADERNILFAAYPYYSFVIADGGDQLTRGSVRCNWAENVPTEQRQIVSLRKSLRLKAGVCRFANAFATEVGLQDWVVEPFGSEQGRIIIIQGNYTDQRDLHNLLLRDLANQGRTQIDMLFCVPPRLVKRSNGTTESVVAKTFQKWGLQTWDATNPNITNQYPIDTSQVRIVQYDSCRGLEAWTVVHLSFDDLYDYKRNSFVPSETEKSDIFFDQAKAAHDYAMRWLMIPLTRGMHTLVLQLSPSINADHPVIAALQAVSTSHPGLIEWWGEK